MPAASPRSSPGGCSNSPASRGFLVRFLFALFIFILAFCSFGGLLRIIYLMFAYPNQLDWSLSGLYWSSLSDFYSFVLFMLVPPRPAYAGADARGGALSCDLRAARTENHKGINACPSI